ncbi:hypothetical protein [Arthrobacter sp. 31Y]|uniref:hypothetical protein n=1 Tax=Arthrobacter sp. 31Y TaxID=1115632 RepID=UPI0004633257|nr:hypothetical protein [Arthrobacter sp. 31Y]
MDLTSLVGQVRPELIPFVIIAYILWEVLRRVLPTNNRDKNVDGDAKPDTPDHHNNDRAIG